jgi:hypothetical protein
VALLGAPAETAPQIEAKSLGTIRQVRPIYRHSIVPGGVQNAHEIATIIKRDPVVAAHYVGVEPALMREERLPMTRLAYVSYRLGDDVYWTRRPVRIPAGEPVLTDGQKTIRARCGNVISAEPLGPAAENEPPPQDLELLVAPMTFIGTPLAYDPPEEAPTIDALPLAGFVALPSHMPPPSAPPPPPLSGGFVAIPDAPVPVPEPGTFVLVGLGGAVALARIVRRRGGSAG